MVFYQTIKKSVMNICACGNAVEDQGSRCPRCAALSALDLGMDSTEAEIRKAYRLLVKVWHPDRFQEDVKLKASADAKLQEVNAAFEFLTSTTDERGPWRPPPRPAEDEPCSPAPTAATDSATSQPPSDLDTPLVTSSLAGRLGIWPTAKLFLKVMAVLFALLLCRYLWIAFDVPDPTSDKVARVYDMGKQTVLKGIESPKQRFIGAVEHDFHRLVPADSPVAPPLPETAQAVQTPPSPERQSSPQSATSPHTDRTSPSPIRLLPYITVGSTRDEVVAQQGTPTSSSEDKLVYGKSELYLKNGAVVGWRVDPVASPIRVKLWPSTAVDPGVSSYTVGSSKDDVLTVQGTPTAFTDNKFEYGKSDVIFHNNKVVSWKEDPASTPLWAR